MHRRRFLEIAAASSISLGPNLAHAATPTTVVQAVQSLIRASDLAASCFFGTLFRCGALPASKFKRRMRFNSLTV